MNRRIFLPILITLLSIITLLMVVSLLLTTYSGGIATERARIERALEEKLQSRVSVHLKDVTLGEMYRWLIEEAGLPMEMTAGFRQWVWREIADRRVTFQLDGVRLIDVLQTFEAEIHYAVEDTTLIDFQDGRCILMLDETDDPRQVGRLHPVPVELFSPACSGEDLDEMVARFVDPPSWNTVRNADGEEYAAPIIRYSTSNTGAEGIVESRKTFLLVKQTERIQREVADLLDAFRRIGKQPDSIEPVLVGGTAEDQRVWRTLREPTDVLADGRPRTLPELCKAIRRRHGINVHLFRPSGPADDRRLDRPLALWLGQVRLETLLGHLSQQEVAYHFTVSGGALWLIPENIRVWDPDPALLRLYPIADLVETHIDRSDLESLVQTMTCADFLAEDTSIVIGDVLICRHNYRVQRNVENLLDAMRYCRCARPRRWNVEQPSEAELWIEGHLHQPLPLVGTELPITLDQCAERLYRRHGINVVLNRRGLAHYEGAWPAILFSSNLPGEPLADYLTRQLKKYFGLTWYRDGEAIVIDSSDRGRKDWLSVRLYNARSLADPAFPLPTDEARRIDDFWQVLTETVDPNTWRLNSGSGYAIPFHDYFFVLQTDAIHRKLARLQDDLAAGDFRRYDQMIELYYYHNLVPDTSIDHLFDSGEPVYQQVEAADLIERYRLEIPCQIDLRDTDRCWAGSSKNRAVYVSSERAVALLVHAVLCDEGFLFNYAEESEVMIGNTTLLMDSTLRDRLRLGECLVRWNPQIDRFLCRTDRWGRSPHVDRTIARLLDDAHRLPRPADLFGPRSDETVDQLLGLLLDDDVDSADRAYADFLLCGYLYALPEARPVLLRRLETIDVAERPDRLILLCRLIAATSSLEEEMLPSLLDAWRLTNDPVREEILLVLQSDLDSPRILKMLENLLDERIASEPDGPSPITGKLITMICRRLVLSDEVFEKMLQRFCLADNFQDFYPWTVRYLRRFDPTGVRARAVYDQWMSGSVELRPAAQRLRRMFPELFDEND